jgi:hypothetical protein
MEASPPNPRSGLIAIAALMGLAACSPSSPAPPADAGPDAGPHGCTYGFLGEATKAPVIEVFGLGPGMTSVPLMNGSMVTLAFPPQGGRVIFAGVRATHVDACAAQLEGVVRDESTKHVMVDSRTINLLPSGDGWGASDPTDISSFANVPVCPNEWSSTNLYGTEYELEVTLTDRGGRSAVQTLKVVPACAEPAHAADCLCICKGGYVLGESCADGGAPDGAPSDAGDGGS